MESLDKTELEEKIEKMELKLADMRKKMYAMGSGTKQRDDAGKVIRHYEKDLEQMKKFQT